MKDTIVRIKNFVCFYLVLPFFVFGILATGSKFPAIASTDTPVEDEQTFYVYEENIFPTPKIEQEIGNPSESYPIVAKDLSKNYNILNDTGETVSEEKLLSIPLPQGEPLVLVVHTHGTECYSDSTSSFASADIDGNYGFYTDDSRTRTQNTDENVIAIGEAFCMTLAENGVPTIQCRIMHDKDDYNSSYSNSRKTILEYLEKFPSINYIIDLHRDSLGGNGAEKIKTRASEIEGCAQVMLVAGCNGNGVVYPDWKENLAIALRYKKAMDKKYPSLSRPIYLRYSRYNLDLAVGSLLLEVGSCGNTFEEARKAAVLAAECFCEMLE